MADSELYGSGDVSRRQFLARAGALGLVTGTGGLLEACGGSSPKKVASTSTTSVKGRQGGVLRIGVGGGGATDSIDAHVFSNASDAIRYENMYEQLLQIMPDNSLQPKLAESFESNAKGDVWTARLRSGIEFHNGKSLTADDVIYTLRRILSPKTGAVNFSQLGMIDLQGLKKLDDRTVRIPLNRPYAVFDHIMADGWGAGIVPVGYDVRNPVGTGPFKYKSFTPGQQTTLDRFDHYWGQKARVDQLVVTDINDTAARLNALLSGQVDTITPLDPAQLNVVKGTGGIRPLIVQTGRWAPITMNVDVPPFNDVRVRQAIRLVMDRKQAVQQALAGNGLVGNDLYAPFDELYAHDLERHRDVEQAKSLLKQAGREGLRVQLVAAESMVGVVEACQILATNAKDAGMNIDLRKVDPSILFGKQFFKWPFAVDRWPAFSYFGNASIADGPKGSFNETHFNDPEFNKLYFQGTAERDVAKRKEIAHEMQQIQFDRGGYLIWAFMPALNAASDKLAGFVTEDKPGLYAGAAEYAQVHFS